MAVERHVRRAPCSVCAGTGRVTVCWTCGARQDLWEEPALEHVRVTLRGVTVGEHDDGHDEECHACEGRRWEPRCEECGEHSADGRSHATCLGADAADRTGTVDHVLGPEGTQLDEAFCQLMNAHRMLMAARVRYRAAAWRADDEVTLENADEAAARLAEQGDAIRLVRVCAMRHATLVASLDETVGLTD